MPENFEIFLCDWAFKGFLSLDRSGGFQKTQATKRIFINFVKDCKQYNHPMAKMFIDSGISLPIKEKIFDWLIKPVHAAKISKIINAPILKFKYGRDLINHFRKHIKLSTKDRELRRRIMKNFR